MIQINPFSTDNLYKQVPIKKQSPSLLRGKNCGDIVTFSGINREKDLLKLPEKEIIKKISESIDKQNFLGEGIDAKVYRIPDTQYCVRLIKKPQDDSEFLYNCLKGKSKETEFHDWTKSLSFNLSEPDKINHVTAKLSNGSTIMKYVEGENCFKYQKETELCYLPVESYQKLYKQVVHAKNHYMIFDCAKGNIIYNPKEKSLTAIDFYEMDKGYPENVRPLSAIFAALNPSKQNCAATKNLAGSLLLAALRDFEPNVKLSSLNFQDYDFSTFLYKFETQYYGKMPPQYALLKNAIVDVQCLKLKEPAGENVTTELNGKLKYCKALIKQLFLDDMNTSQSRYSYFYSNPF